MASRIPPGLAGAIFAALLAAAMSSIDSGVNSFATVVTVDFSRLRQKPPQGSRVFQARIITLIVGTVVTVAAIYLDGLTGMDDILTILPKTFNSLVGSLGGLFLAGMLIPRASSRAVWPAAVIGLVVALGVAYSRDLLNALGPSTQETLASLLGADFAQAPDGQRDGIHLDHSQLDRGQHGDGLAPEFRVSQAGPRRDQRPDLGHSTRAVAVHPLVTCEPRSL